MTIELSSTDDGIAWIEFKHRKKLNPFSSSMNLELKEIAQNVSQDTNISAVILAGANGHSFSVGGDFEEIQQLNDAEAIASYLGNIIDLYQEVLKIPQPTISCISGHAIGQGLQMALLGDIRIASSGTVFAMPELKNGVACSLGFTILERFLGRGQLLDMIVWGEFFDERTALEHQLIGEIIPSQELRQKGKEIALKLSQFATTPYTHTKKLWTNDLVDKLENIREKATHAHIESILSKSGAQHFDKVLKGKQD